MKLLIITVVLTLLGSSLGWVSTAQATQSPDVEPALVEVPGGFTVTVDNDYVQIMPKAAKDANVDITNDGPGEIFILVWDDEHYIVAEYVLKKGESKVIGVEKGGGFGVGLESGSSASGSYTVS